MKQIRWQLPAGILLILIALGVTLAPVAMPMTGLVLGALGLLLAAWGLLYRRAGKCGKRFFNIMALLACLGVVCLIVQMIGIRGKGRTDWDRVRETQYGVVLGAGVREDGQPTRIMRQRLQAAEEYLTENPEGTLILSGGQGPGEPVAEAACMYEALVSRGISPDRLLQETESMTTLENLRNSLEIINARGGTDRPLAVISSEFHLARALYLAEKLDIEACPVAARTDQWYFRWNYTLREVFAFIKARLQTEDR